MRVLSYAEIECRARGALRYLLAGSSVNSVGAGPKYALAPRFPEAAYVSVVLYEPRRRQGASSIMTRSVARTPATREQVPMRPVPCIDCPQPLP